MSNPPAGWYPDANGDSRYWDGNAWTEQTQPSGEAVDPAQPSQSAESSQPAQPAEPEQAQPEQGQQAWQGGAQQQSAYGQQQSWQRAQQQGAQQPWQGGQQQSWQGGPAGAQGQEPWQSGQGTPQKSKTPLIIGAIVAVLLLVIAGAVAAFLIAGGDDDDKSADDPESSQSSEPTDEPTDGPTSDDPTTSPIDPQTSPAPGGDAGPAVTAVTGYLDAVTRQDCPTMKSHVTGAAEAAIPDCDGFTPNPGYSAEYEITGSRMVGEKAEVDTTESFTIDGSTPKTGNCTYSVIQESGTWLVEGARCS
ncbi:hypothetical protein BJ980_002145 [Nocardioides daedukensis]|uniref:DUF2510 domain-containing protein n=1 Tax=Nocardioides daedukensis TaxID=634462 RepID=A0A7Y9S2D4_9ACTN|nr:DUF2510 domain-containing protein [Nocardioides daedukensis]NYG59222.1 hypothetical protein [Nocardioides daedukensis]